METTVDLNGVTIWPGWLSPDDQAEMVQDIRAVVAAAPFFTPETPRGQKMSVRMTAAGDYGWISDRRGYRYAPTHPSGPPWPPIPASVLRVWDALSGSDRQPQCCLVNWYADTARMGLHQDRDEADLTQPVLSISLGDDALFRVGGIERGGPTRSIWLRSGDVALLAGPARLAYHGIDRVLPGSSTLLRNGGRINLTLRVVDQRPAFQLSEA
ncbi:alpha-ketoglutarate-dependent dioxygenase AlkB family protein [Roseicyclus marinus]|uniref:alpha-ketoglutarate-dependent dioxygenase AlkB family protein n=1 Tax=Roseicyclus marinus TaxID=2161673 RepID=UPI00240FE81A|nr:alpha-ketoglutarate-dependent dioxygenase AlkB [Roseicyclus marinus]MDG3041465.1 alpha-ketoglutarate-dependent dioxygenase AlkB [Roseicyclus marinus]